MLVVKVELWPHGDGTQAKELGRMVIAHSGPAIKGGYNYTVRARAEAWDPIHGVAEGDGVVKGYDRLQHVWNLVREALLGIRWKR